MDQRDRQTLELELLAGTLENVASILYGKGSFGDFSEIRTSDPQTQIALTRMRTAIANLVGVLDMLEGGSNLPQIDENINYCTTCMGFLSPDGVCYQCKLEEEQKGEERA